MPIGDVSIGGWGKFDTLRRKRSKNAAVAPQICFGFRRAPRIMIPEIDRTFLITTAGHGEAP